MTTDVNFKVTFSKWERQGAHVAAEITQNYTTTQSLLCLQVQDSELQQRGSSPFNLTTPMKAQSSTLGRGRRAPSPQQPPQKGPSVRTNLTGEKKKKRENPGQKHSAPRSFHAKCGCGSAGYGMATHIQPQLAACKHQQTEADVNHTSNSVVCVNYCVTYINFSAQNSQKAK